MKYRLALPVAAAALSLLASSCTPWVEPGDAPPPPMPPNGDVAARRNAPANLDDPDHPTPRRVRKTDPSTSDGDSTARGPGGSGDTQSKTDDASPTDQPAPTQKKKERLPMGVKVPGKPNIVLSPYTNKRVDVSDVGSGQVATDPTSGGKHFIVP